MEKPPIKENKFQLLLKIIIGIILLERWLFKPLSNFAEGILIAAKRKNGSLFRLTFSPSRRPRRKVKKGAVSMNWKIAGFTVGALLTVAVTAILAVSLWYRFAPAKAVETLEGKAA